MKIWVESKNAIFQNSGISQWMYGILLGIAEKDKSKFTLVSPKAEKLPFSDLKFPSKLLPWPALFPRRVSSLVYDLFIFRMFARLNKPDLIFTPYFDVLMPKRIKSIITIHDLCFLEAAEQYSFFRRSYFISLMKINLKRASLVFTVSQSSKTAIESLLGLPSEIIVVLPNELDPDFKSIQPNNAEIESFKAPYSESSKLVLYTGGLENRKNVPRLLSSIDSLNSKGMTVVLLITGSPHKYWLDIVGQKRIADSSVSFLGFLDSRNLKIAYSAADAVVYPSLSEGFGRACIEAMNSGTPLACSDIPVFKEVSGNYATYFDPKDQSSIETALRAILQEGSERIAVTEKSSTKYDSKIFQNSLELLLGKI